MIGIEFGAVFEISQLNYECHHLLLALLLKLVARTCWPASVLPPANRTGTSGLPGVIRGRAIRATARIVDANANRNKR